MQKSEQVGELFAALAKAQGAFRPALKSSTMTVTKAGATAHYADVASVWAACRDALSANGLSVLQPATADGLSVTVTTMLAHASGQWIAETLTAPAADDSTKSIGSVITSLRRLALPPMVGVATEDDPELVAAEEAARGEREAEADRRAAKLAERLAAKSGAVGREMPNAVALPPALADADRQAVPASYERLAELRQAMFDRVRPDDEDAAWKAILANRGVTSARELDLAGLEELTRAIESRIAAFDEEAKAACAFRPSPDGLAAPAALAG